MKHRSTGCFAACLVAVALLFFLPVVHGAEIAQWEVFGTSYESAKAYPNAFTEVEVDVVFTPGEKQWKVPAFWTGDRKWTVRFAPPTQGNYTYRVECTDKAKGFNVVRIPCGPYYHTRVQVQTYDVTPLLRNGANAIGATLGNGWYCGGWQYWEKRIRARYGTDPSLLVQLELEFADGRRQTLVTDDSWRGSTDGPLRFTLVGVVANSDCPETGEFTCSDPLPNRLAQIILWEQWEAWDGQHAQGGMNSLNHYSFGAVGEYLFGMVGGIQPDAPGYKRIRIQPVIGESLTWAKASDDSIHGRIGSNWKC